VFPAHLNSVKSAVDHENSTGETQQNPVSIATKEMPSNEVHRRYLEKTWGELQKQTHMILNSDNFMSFSEE
jgi:hypothetical protein